MSRVEIKTIPRAKENSVTLRNGKIVVRVTAPAEDGKANDAVITTLAEYWHTPKSRLAIVRGATNRNKVIEKLDG